MDDANWTQLCLSNSSNKFPKLYVTVSFSSSTYSVVLTDLTRLWSESLDRRQICRRALNEDTPIDPSEDPQQLAILLEKINSALRNEARTECDFISGSDDVLTLQASAPLPAPFDTLRWNIHLRLQSPRVFTQQLVLPLLGSAYRQKPKQSDLIKRLHEKDQVISKLLAGLEASGTDIATIFPSAMSSKTTKRATQQDQAARHVKGLGQFSELEWKESFNESIVDTSASDFIACLPRNGSQTVPLVIEQGVSNSIESWWVFSGQPGQEIQKTDMQLDSSHQSTRPHEPETINAVGEPGIEEESETDSEFQRQQTPPQLVQQSEPGLIDHIRLAKAQVEETDLLTGLSQIDAPNKIGSLGGRKNPIRSRPLGTTAKEDILATDSHLITPPYNPLNELGKGKIGSIGGIRKNPAPGRTEQESLNLRNSTHIDVRLRNNEHREPSVGLKNEILDNQSPPTSQGTPQEKADRKREELKAQLQARSQAPAKKKRRF